MKKWLAPIFGLVPFAYGIFATFSMNAMPAEIAFFTGPILSAVFLVLWSRLAKIANYHLDNQVKTILYMHIPCFLVIIIMLMNAAAQEPFVFGLFETILSYYLMPVLPLCLMLSLFTQNVYFVYASLLIFMLSAAYLGCNSKRRYVR